jgi:protein-S-isoprenylcysteine O-methyltransferase Ste14
MYLSLALVILGLAIGTANPWMAVMAPLFMIYLQERVVRREEAYLGAHFGEAYAAYRKRVRRWF